MIPYDANLTTFLGVPQSNGRTISPLCGHVTRGEELAIRRQGQIPGIGFLRDRPLAHNSMRGRVHNSDLVIIREHSHSRTIMRASNVESALRTRSKGFTYDGC